MSGGKQGWKVRSDLFGATHVYDEGGLRLTNDWAARTEGWEPIAHRIAAAPELYEALKDMLADYEGACAEEPRVLRQARAALASARGESHE